MKKTINTAMNTLIDATADNKYFTGKYCKDHGVEESGAKFNDASKAIKALSILSAKYLESLKSADPNSAEELSVRNECKRLAVDAIDKLYTAWNITDYTRISAEYALSCAITAKKSTDGDRVADIRTGATYAKLLQINVIDVAFSEYVTSVDTLESEYNAIFAKKERKASGKKRTKTINLPADKIRAMTDEQRATMSEIVGIDLNEWMKQYPAA